MSKNDPRKALGKGLHSLLPQRASAPPPPAPIPSPPAEGNVALVDILAVSPNPNQPRREFDPLAMMELTQSIERDGIIQPIIVRRTGDNEYQIIAGERRWRAAKTAGLTRIPVIARTADDQKVLELAIVENIQREDLNPIELAQAFHRMTVELGLSHDEIGEKTGKDRATITNTIRLLQLPEDLQQLVSAKKLSPGHARALLKLQDQQIQREMAERCIREGWSVRQAEEYTRPTKGPSSPARPHAKQPQIEFDPNVKAAIGEIERKLGTRVRIVEKGREKGQIEIEYYSADDLDRIYNLIVTD
ncbi:MAG TPA: ParB/RepB/Spo0J family partition protein [Bryobacteraceae bacterium]|nr:ParB/RepB/Spo0J family partition protein [Bryobacteraceae bacterium]